MSGFQRAAVLNAKTPDALAVLNCTLELELKSADKVPLSGIAAEQNMPLTISGSELAVTLRSAGTASLLTQLQKAQITIVDSNVSSKVFSRQSSGGLVDTSQAELRIENTSVELAVVGERLLAEGVP